MKKVTAGIITVVMVALMTVCVSSASEEILHNTSSWNAMEKIQEYAESQDLDNWLIGNNVNGVLYGMGIVRTKDFIRETGSEWSIENFEKWLKESEWKVVDVYTRVVGMIDGANVYRMQAQSETVSLATDGEGNPYYCVDAIFIVYSEDEK